MTLWYFRLSLVLLSLAIFPLPWILQDPQLVSVDLLGALLSLIVAVLSMVRMVGNKQGG
ncbi:MAG: hypothetical protein K6T83_09415 [Alicyclobacillus sp.]|nr:hypothetical protein [Alicyclobacillus sp.]